MVQFLHGDGHGHTAEAAAHDADGLAAERSRVGHIFAVFSDLFRLIQESGVKGDLLRVGDQQDTLCHHGFVDAQMVHGSVVVGQLHASETHMPASFKSSAARSAIRDASSMRLAKKSGSA